MRKFFPGSRTPGGELRFVSSDLVRNAAFGRWPDILATLGIPNEVLSKRRNQPCPCCGGTDRFQFIDKGLGRFVCRSLDRQGGDGFSLVMHWLGCDFKNALLAVSGALGLSAAVEIERTPIPLAIPAPVKHDNSATIGRLWSEAMPIRTGDPVALYLESRGLDLATYPTPLRHHPALDYWTEVDNAPVKIATSAALLAQVTSPTGAVVGVHRIYLTADGCKVVLMHPDTGALLNSKKLLTAYEGAMRGAAVRLYKPEGGVLALAEGIETALAVRLGAGLPCWAAVSAWGLENILLPEEVTDVYVMADHDTSGTGQKAAKTLARRLLTEARRVRVVIPERPGTDWLDVLNERAQGEAS